MSVYGSRWSRKETLLAFGLYCELPFGKLHQGNQLIIDLARVIGRTPSSVVMKACNFASLDPAQQERGIKGLVNASKTEKEIWKAFFADSASLVDELDAARANQGLASLAGDFLDEPSGPSEVVTEVRVRRHQKFFRSAVMSTYAGRCALTGLAVPELLIASHIVPWAQSPERRCDPTNGVCLNVLHDRAFDRGLITFDKDLFLVPSPVLLDGCDLGLLSDTLPLIGRRLHTPDRFQPNADALQYHRDQIFKS